MMQVIMGVTKRSRQEVLERSMARQRQTRMLAMALQPGLLHLRCLRPRTACWLAVALAQSRRRM